MNISSAVLAIGKQLHDNVETKAFCLSCNLKKKKKKEADIEMDRFMSRGGKGGFSKNSHAPLSYMKAEVLLQE